MTSVFGREEHPKDWNGDALIDKDWWHWKNIRMDAKYFQKEGGEGDT